MINVLFCVWLLLLDIIFARFIHKVIQVTVFYLFALL